MLGRPLVAVVTPVYNGSPYLERMIACVQAQTYANIVHVILDNASTDDTPEVIDRARGGRVPILTQRNASLIPVTSNWNKAMTLVPTEARYVKLQCADDLMRIETIEKMTAAAEADPAIDLVLARDVFNGLLRPNGLDPNRTLYSGRELLRLCLTAQSRWQPWPHVFFRATPERLSRPFDPACFPAADADFAMRELLGGSVAIINEPLLYTRNHSSSVSSNEGGVASAGVLGNVERTMIYGPAVLSPTEMARVRRGCLTLMARWLLRWRYAGKRDWIIECERRLAAVGVTIRPRHYVEALLRWPYDKMESRAHLPDSGNAFSEASFLPSEAAMRLIDGTSAMIPKSASTTRLDRAAGLAN